MEIKFKILIGLIIAFAGEFNAQALEEKRACHANIKVSVTCNQMGQLILKSVTAGRRIQTYSYWIGSINYCNEQKEIIQNAVIHQKSQLMIPVWKSTAEYSILGVDISDGEFINLEQGWCSSIKNCRIFQKDLLFSIN